MICFAYIPENEFGIPSRNLYVHELADVLKEYSGNLEVINFIADILKNEIDYIPDEVLYDSNEQESDLL